MQENQFDSDIIVIGAGPAGISFARGVAPSGLKVTLIEKSPESVLADPPYDGREIALTHTSRDIMQKLDMWQRVAEDEIYFLREARVLDGESDYSLTFPHPKKVRGREIDTLGYLISNHNIRRSAYESIKGFENVSFQTGQGVTKVTTDAHKATVTLENGEVLTAKMLVAADSRFSSTRRQLGISTDMHDFGRTVMVFRTKHTVPNEEIASECFFYGRTLALLPLGDYMTNCVVTIDSHRADEILGLSKEELGAEMMRMLNNRFGKMEVISEVHTYPLVGVHARNFVAERSALIGDASVGMHPVTAHGFNLGIGGADILATVINEAHARGEDFASQAVLKRYERRHMPHTLFLFHGTNSIVKLFTNETAPARILRSAVVRLSNNLPPVKFFISRQLTGF
ncbi:MAG: 5-demethoxyubiquinol-8 5-hydroxylase UbiM [Alcaligenaceae bacterium]|nr:5-demethoxyubiquinol-8 5-hydroxylase UbiM [Alcaligenaceae bacterium]